MGAAKATVGLVGWVALCLLAGFAGSLFTTPAIPEWYRTLNKPAWTPPNSLFAPVWTTLYLMMGVAAWLVWRGALAGTPTALALFGVQLALNVAWSGIFFGLRAPGAGFVGIVLLWGAILVTALLFWRISLAAGMLMLPYLAWVTFAAALNYAVWRMNA